ncbi:MAG: energy-coupling factor ABC transporter permease [Bacillota bacterium]
MHMSDALISPAVGGVMWAAAAGITAYSAKKVRKNLDEAKAPLMGVLGAFIFTAQMINFTIPGTASSGHLGGGMILAVLLGPSAGFLAMVSILVIQALIFCDGGLLALGCNIINLGFYSCFIAYPLVYRPIAGKNAVPWRIAAGAILASIIGLQFGSFSVVLETVFSGITELPFKIFVLLMQPIHLAIGVFEGLITAAVILFVRQVRPEILEKTAAGEAYGNMSLKRAIAAILLLAFLTGGFISWFASSYPDGLEWSVSKTVGGKDLRIRSGIVSSLTELQKKISVFPDYGFKKQQPANTDAANKGGTSLSGIAGALMTLFLVSLIGFGLQLAKKRASK